MQLIEPSPLPKLKTFRIMFVPPSISNQPTRTYPPQQMPPIAPVYTWSQDAEAVTLSVPLKGTKAALVDLFGAFRALLSVMLVTIVVKSNHHIAQSHTAASTYVKLSFGRYLLELDLPHPIDDAAATASAKHGVLTVTLPKAIKGGEAWASLTLPPPTATATTSTTTGLDKQAIQERRAVAIEEQRSQEQRRAEEARERRAEMEQAAFRAQVGRPLIDSRLQFFDRIHPNRADHHTHTRPGQMAMQERARQEAAARAAEAKRQAEAAVFGHPMPPPPVPPSSTSKLAPAPTTLPPPPVRVMREATVRVRFTPRAFPTPARESKAAEEEDWLAKKQPSSSVVPSTGAGNGDCETHPAWLKARGDDLFKRADFAGALSTYDACLAADATHGGALANRAACQLKLGRLE